MRWPSCQTGTHNYHVAGRTGDRIARHGAPISRSHHTLSDVGLIGGRHVPMPGEGSQARHGARCLDERPDFRRHVLEVLRQPLEKGVIQIQSRGRAESPYSCGLRGTAIDLKRLGPNSVAFHPSQGIPLALLASGAVSGFSLDTGPGLEY
jgi:hypothetical protein